MKIYSSINMQDLRFPFKIIKICRLLKAAAFFVLILVPLLFSEFYGKKHSVISVYPSV